MNNVLCMSKWASMVGFIWLHFAENNVEMRILNFIWKTEKYSQNNTKRNETLLIHDRIVCSRPVVCTACFYGPQKTGQCFDHKRVGFVANLFYAQQPCVITLK
jgi:hypothetical protein